MFFKKPENPKTVLEGLDRALEILNHQYEQKVIDIETYSKKADEIAKKRIKYQKELEKKKR